MSDLTFMAVHAHPDDEASSTGGVLARYSEEGMRTVVVTCTNGEYGDTPDGIKPGAEGHDAEAVAAVRKTELEQACRTLGVTDLEMLGYHDSGMADWEYKGREHVFASAPFDEAVGRIVTLLDKYRPDVVVTYDPDSIYDHPDHVQASRVTMEAVRRTGIARKAYYTALRGSRFMRLREIAIERGIELPEMPEPSEDFLRRVAEAEARITTDVDVSRYLARKRQALHHHASQMQSGFFNRFPPEAFDLVFSSESFVRVHDTTGAPLPEDDLFAGLR
jgi:LmbE family N-acetylglucosaminyl deacetylase